MKRDYLNPEMEIIDFENEDIITDSGFEKEGENVDGDLGGEDNDSGNIITDGDITITDLGN
jgi:hypothetical protein